MMLNIKSSEVLIEFLYDIKKYYNLYDEVILHFRRESILGPVHSEYSKREVKRLLPYKLFKVIK